MSCVAFAATFTETAWVDLPDQRSVEIASVACFDNVQRVASGVVIDDGTAVTVAHVIWGSSEFALRDRFGTWHRPEIVHLDLERDLAVLRVPALRASTMDRAPSRASAAWTGEVVRLLDGTTTGTSAGVILRRVKAEVAVVGDRDATSARRGFEVALDIEGGDSGAAIVDTGDRLVGIVFARSRRSTEGIAWATSSQEVDALLERPEAGLPSWECDAGFDDELILRP